jgi:hypothetical protein
MGMRAGMAVPGE